MSSPVKAKQEELIAALSRFEENLQGGLGQKLLEVENSIDVLQNELKEAKAAQSAMKSELLTYKGQYSDLEKYLAEEEKRPKVCPSCNYPLQNLFKVCPMCGTPIPQAIDPNVDYLIPAGPVMNKIDNSGPAVPPPPPSPAAMNPSVAKPATPPPAPGQKYFPNFQRESDRGNTGATPPPVPSNGQKMYPNFQREADRGDAGAAAAQTDVDNAAGFLSKFGFGKKPQQSNTRPAGPTNVGPAVPPPPPGAANNASKAPVPPPPPPAGAKAPARYFPNFERESDRGNSNATGNQPPKPPVPGQRGPVSVAPTGPIQLPPQTVAPVYATGNGSVPPVPPAPPSGGISVPPVPVSPASNSLPPTRGVSVPPPPPQASRPPVAPPPAPAAPKPPMPPVPGKPVSVPPGTPAPAPKPPVAPPPVAPSPAPAPAAPAVPKPPVAPPPADLGNLSELPAISGRADAEKYFELHESAQGYVLDRYIGTGFNKIVIPDSIDGKSVVALAGKCFLKNEELVRVIVGNGVRFIGSECFLGCTGLKSVELPSALDKIKTGAFMDCSSLENVKFPEEMSLIGASAFANCKSLKSITVPNGIKWISEMCFSKCSGIKTVVFADGIRAIEASAFADCSSLEGFELPMSVVSLGDKAFYNCRSLNKVVIPPSVTRIGNRLFFPKMGQNMIPKLNVFCSNGSAIMEFCKKNQVRTKGAPDMPATAPILKNAAYAVELAYWMKDKDEQDIAEMKKKTIEVLDIPEYEADDLFIEHSDNGKDLHGLLPMNLSIEEAESLLSKLPGSCYVQVLHAYDGRIDQADKNSQSPF